MVTVKTNEKSATVVAKFRNVKLSFVGGAAVADLSGDWHFVAGNGEYDVMTGSELSKEWDMTLAATDELNKNYNATFKLGEFAPLTLKAAFDGQTLTISFNEDYLDAEKKIGFVNMYGELRPGEIIFTLEKENLLKLGTSGITIYDELKGENLQWYLAGNATRGGAAEEEGAFDWVGTYVVTAGDIELKDEAYKDKLPKTAEMEIAYDDEYDEYYVANLFGQNLYDLWYWGNGIVVAPSAEQENQATIATASMYDGNIYLRTISGGVFLVLRDATGGTAPLNLEIKEDGTISIDNFMVMKEDQTSGQPVLTEVAIYKNVTIAKKGSTTGIENAIVEKSAVEGIFDLLGRKLDAITAPGLYIVNGKKVLVK